MCRNVSLLEIAESLFLKQSKEIPHFCLDAVVGLNVKIFEYFPEYFAFSFTLPDNIKIMIILMVIRRFLIKRNSASIDRATSAIFG